MPNVKPTILFEDEDLLVLDKPAGLIVHEGVGVEDGTVVDFVAKHLGSSPLEGSRWGLLHRLDKDTSGLLLIAKTIPAFEFLKNLFKNRQIKKEYRAVVEGALTPEAGSIRIPLARSEDNRTSYAPSSGGRPAETEYQVLQSLPGYTYLAAFPKTGRTHQIRVHFAAISHPVVGDATYGKADSKLSRHFLHAYKLNFTDWNGEPREFVADLPIELTSFLNDLQ